MKTDNTGFIELIPLTGKKNTMEMKRQWDLISRQRQVQKGWSLLGCAAELEVLVPNPSVLPPHRYCYFYFMKTSSWADTRDCQPGETSWPWAPGKGLLRCSGLPDKTTDLRAPLLLHLLFLWFCKDISLFSLAICLVLILIYSVQRDAALRNFQRHQKTLLGMQEHQKTLLGIQEVLQNCIKGKTKWEEEISLNSNRLTQSKPKNLIKPQSSNQARAR